MMRTTMGTMALVCLVALSALAGGCSDEEQRPTIGLSVLSTNNPFFNEIAEAMKVEADKHGWDVIVVDGKNDAAAQQDQVKDFITRKCIAIVLTPCDSKAVGAAIKEANDANIPVFTADITCLDESVDVVTHVATDNLGGGKLAAVAMVEALKARGDATGEIAIIDYPEVESVILRTKGFKEKLAELNAADDVDLTIVKQLPGQGERAKSEAAMRDILQSNPDIKGLFAINDPSALGAVAALKEKVEDIVVIGFDGQIDGKQAIKAGQIYADPIQFPKKIGQMTVQAIADHMAGKTPGKELLIDTALYRKADADKDPALK